MAGSLGANAQAITNQILSSIGGGFGGLNNVQFAPNINFINGPVPQTQISGFGIPPMSFPSITTPGAGAGAFAAAGAGASAGFGGGGFAGAGLGGGDITGAGAGALASAGNNILPLYYPQPYPILGLGGLGLGGLGLGSLGNAQTQAQAQAGGDGSGLLGILALLSLMGGDTGSQNPGFPGNPGYPGYPGYQDYNQWYPPYYNQYPPQNYPPEPPPPPPPTVTTTPGDNAPGMVVGDPHFTGFGGGHYDVMGQNGNIYNILSDKNVQFNAKYGSYNGQNNVTVITEAGLKIGNDQTGITKIDMKPGANSTPTLDGQAMEKGKTYSFDTGLRIRDDKGQLVAVNGSATWDGTKLTVNTGEYQVKLTNQGQNLEQETAITNIGVAADGVTPHGLLGQTADGKVHNGKTGAGAQGEGAIEGTVNDYKVSDIFGDDFKYNRFGAQANTQAQYGVGAGKGGTAK